CLRDGYERLGWCVPLWGALSNDRREHLPRRHLRHEAQPDGLRPRLLHVPRPRQRVGHRRACRRQRLRDGVYRLRRPPHAPRTAGSRGGGDTFVTKLNPSGSALVYSTFLGHSDFDEGFGIAVDAAGNAYVTGRAVTNEFEFPTTSGALQCTSSGHTHAFVTK